MIELIFVIVIIGILAAVAIPKLAATRDDAKDAKVRANVATCIQDYVSGYTARGSVDSANIPACSGLSVSPSSANSSTTETEVTVSGTLSNGNSYSKTATFRGTGVSL
jgi:type II secretory pathway pseudopilin PulG